MSESSGSRIRIAADERGEDAVTIAGTRDSARLGLALLLVFFLADWLVGTVSACLALASSDHLVWLWSAELLAVGALVWVGLAALIAENALALLMSALGESRLSFSPRWLTVTTRLFGMEMARRHPLRIVEQFRSKPMRRRWWEVRGPRRRDPEHGFCCTMWLGYRSVLVAGEINHEEADWLAGELNRMLQRHRGSPDRR